MSVAHPTSSFDARGRVIPLSEDEIRRRNEEAIRALEEVATIGDMEEQTLPSTRRSRG